MTKLVRNPEYDKEPSLPGLNTPLEEGEPVFVLRARDKLAPGMAALWSALRRGESVDAINAFANLMNGPAKTYVDAANYEDSQKARSALAKSIDMSNWREEKGLVTFPLFRPS